MRLYDVANHKSWLWAGSCHIHSDRVVLGSDAGVIDMVQMSFTAVHSLYRDRYAFRENLTEILVHHLGAERKARIKCKDLVQRLALYRNKLAVQVQFALYFSSNIFNGFVSQLTDRVCIYESNADETMDMHFRLRRERIMIASTERDRPSDLMVVTSLHLVMCRDNMMELYTLDGHRVRVWIFDEKISYVKVNGGLEGKEAIIVGISSGIIYKVFVDNPFPVELGKVVISFSCNFFADIKYMPRVIDSD
jgi:intraflagellar transport protein 122